MLTELTLVRLPPPLSEAIDKTVQEFQHREDIGPIQAIRRWHGADLWIVFADEPHSGQRPGFITRRVTIATYSDTPDRLLFLPDIVLTGPQGRFALPPERLMEFGSHSLSVSQAVAAYAQVPSAAPNVSDLLYNRLKEAWTHAQSLAPEDAIVLLP